MTRRELLSRLIKGAGLTAAGIVLVPATINVFSPLLERQRSARWQAVGPIDVFPVGEINPATVEVPRPQETTRPLSEKAVYVWRETADDIVVFSRNCTDLSCGLIWDPGSEWFFCPCHGGIFAKNGERMAGPPQRPLYRYDTRVQDGVLEIDLNSLPPLI